MKYCVNVTFPEFDKHTVLMWKGILRMHSEGVGGGGRIILCNLFSQVLQKTKCVSLCTGVGFSTLRESTCRRNGHSCDSSLWRGWEVGCVGSVGGRRAEKWAHGLGCHQRSVNSICRNDCDSRMPSASLNSRWKGLHGRKCIFSYNKKSEGWEAPGLDSSAQGGLHKPKCL